MLDLVFVAMFAVVPVMVWSIWQVRRHRRYERHKRTQLALGTLLLVVVLGFELEIRLSGWEDLARQSPHWQPGWWNDAIDYALAVHLVFAIPTPLVWIYVIVRALSGFPRPARPAAHSRQHKIWARVAALAMAMTAVTGWVFYWLAFAAT